MRRVFLAAVMAAAVASVSAAEWEVSESAAPVSAQQQSARADLEGTWSARLWDDENVGASRQRRLQLQMNLDDERNWSNWGQSVPVSAFSNLPANLDPPQDVAFELRREAGVIRFTGRFENGRGVGHLYFTANRAFERDMEQQTGDVFTERELFTFALLDVSRTFVKELQDLGYTTVTLDDARKARIHGVTKEYIQMLRAEGLRDASLDEAVKFRIHGITAAYVKEMRAANLAHGLDDLLQLKIHGVTPAFVREMAALGYRNVDPDTIVKFRIHGITPAFVKDLADAGYKNLSEDELVDWAIHGRRLLKHRRK